MTVALSFDTVRAIAQGQLPDMAALVGLFGDGALLSVRSSSQAPDWGGPGTILNIGMNDAVHARLEESFGTSAADVVLCPLHPRLRRSTSCGWNPTGSTGR
jgi:pyruvate,orthophosphate dikinase